MFFIQDTHTKAAVMLRDPVRMPMPGDRLVAAAPFYTPAHQYEVGDVFELVARTDDAPWGMKCSLCNWVVKDKFFTSVWSNIEWALNDGHLVFEETACIA